VSSIVFWEISFHPLPEVTWNNKQQWMVQPRRYDFYADNLTAMRAELEKLLAYKSRWYRVRSWLFFGGTGLLMGVKLLGMLKNSISERELLRTRANCQAAIIIKERVAASAISSSMTWHSGLVSRIVSIKY